MSSTIFILLVLSLLCYRELRHRNLVSLIGVSIDATPVYIVTEYMAKVCMHIAIDCIMCSSIGVHGGLFKITW